MSTTPRMTTAAPAALFALLLVPAAPAEACKQPPSFPPCGDGGVKLVAGFEPGKGPCTSGTVMVALSICSDTGGVYQWSVGVPVGPPGGCSLPPLFPPGVECRRTSPSVPQTGSVAVAPDGCETVMVEYRVAGCEPAAGALSLSATVTDPSGSTCMRDVSCLLVNCLDPDEGFPTLTIMADSDLTAAPPAGSAHWSWVLGYDGEEDPSPPHCLVLTQVNGLGDELFPVTLRDEAGNVLSSDGFVEEPPGTERSEAFAVVSLASGERMRVLGECPFKGMCYPGIENEFRLEARLQDPMTGDCLPVAASYHDLRAVVGGFDPLRPESVADLGGGRMQVEWLIRGPLTAPTLSLRFDGHLEVEDASAFFLPDPDDPSVPIFETANQPVVEVHGNRGGARVSLSLDRIDPRDADFTAFEDQVIVRVVLVDPSGEPHRGKVDDGAKLSWLDGDGNEQQVRLSPIRVR